MRKDLIENLDDVVQAARAGDLPVSGEYSWEAGEEVFEEWTVLESC